MMAPSPAGRKEVDGELENGRDWGTPGWYADMSDQQLETTLRGLQPDSREWSIVRREIEARAVSRRGSRNQWIFIGAVAAGPLAIAVLLFVLAQ